MLQPDSFVDLLIEKPVAGGRMLARHDGQVVLVSGAIPGERVRARIERTARGVAFAETREVIDAASTRRAAQVDAACGGNVYAHVAYDAQIDLKRAVLRDALAHGGRIAWSADLPVAASPEQAYRLRARLHVRHGRVGFFREGTHALCDAADTGQLRADAVDAVRAFVARTPRPWLDAIDAIELTENLPADQRALHLIWSTHARIPSDLPREWTAADWPGITGISGVLKSSGRTGTIAGTPFVSDPIASLLPPTSVGDGGSVSEARLQRHAASFFQANRFLLPSLVSTVLRHATATAAGGGPIIDCYAGVGLFAVSLAASGRSSIVAIEGDPSSARDLGVNAAPFASRVRVEQSSVEQALARLAADPAATIIVDPPRTGMSHDALDGVLRAGAARLVYVSCDVATLARDLRRILDHGYDLTHLEAFDLFPNTAHIESLAVLDRRNP